MPAGTTITVTPATIEYEDVVVRAAQAFETAGLALPPVEVVFSDDDRDCDLHLGVFQSAREPWRITICSELAFVPVHELAHAWIEANVDEANRNAYVELRDKLSWNSSKHDWRERGVEDAAFVIQQNLMAKVDGELSEEWESRASAFELLVGAPSPLRDNSGWTVTGRPVFRSALCLDDGQASGKRACFRGPLVSVLSDSR